MAALTLDEAFLELDRAEDSWPRDVLLKTTRAFSAVPHGTSSDFVERTKEYIFEHIGQDLSLEDIAEHFYLSPSHFSRTFKAQAGETLIRFISRCKMEYAAQSLSNTNLKIYDVCEQVGYKAFGISINCSKHTLACDPPVTARECTWEEREMTSRPNVRRIRSYSFEGFSSVTLRMLISLAIIPFVFSGYFSYQLSAYCSGKRSSPL